MQSRWMVTGSQHNVPTFIEKMCYLIHKRKLDGNANIKCFLSSYARSADQVCEEDDDDDDKK